jgi:ATP-binding protein involved in chromosome partitioning
MSKELNKENVLELLKTVSVQGKEGNIVDNGVVKEVKTKSDIFGKKIEIDTVIESPAVHVRKKLEDDITEALRKEYDESVDLKINTKVVIPESEKEKPLKKIKNIIAIASGKGGVGKSTVTANVATTLANMGFKVGVLDTDVYGPSIPIMFDTQMERPRAIRKGEKTMIIPIEAYGVKNMSIGYFAQPGQAVIWRGSMANSAINQMVFDTDWGDLDFLLIDLPPGTGDIQLSVMQTLPVTGAVVVTTPQNVAIADVKKSVDMFKNPTINVPVLGIVENMSYFTPAECPENKYYIFGKDGGKFLAKDLDVAFLGEIPLVQSIREAGDSGRPASLQENSPIADAFEKITQNIVEETVKRNKTLPPTEKIKITNQAGCSVK